jgi:hypothetical protein
MAEELWGGFYNKFLYVALEAYETARHVVHLQKREDGTKYFSSFSKIPESRTEYFHKLLQKKKASECVDEIPDYAVISEEFKKRKFGIYMYDMDIGDFRDVRSFIHGCLDSLDIKEDLKDDFKPYVDKFSKLAAWIYLTGDMDYIKNKIEDDGIIKVMDGIDQLGDSEEVASAVLKRAFPYDNSEENDYEWNSENKTLASPLLGDLKIKLESSEDSRLVDIVFQYDGIIGKILPDKLEIFEKGLDSVTYDKFKDELLGMTSPPDVPTRVYQNTLKHFEDRAEEDGTSVTSSSPVPKPLPPIPPQKPIKGPPVPRPPTPSPIPSLTPTKPTKKTSRSKPTELESILVQKEGVDSYGEDTGLKWVQVCYDFLEFLNRYYDTFRDIKGEEDILKWSCLKPDELGKAESVEEYVFNWSCLDMGREITKIHDAIGKEFLNLGPLYKFLKVNYPNREKAWGYLKEVSDEIEKIPGKIDKKFKTMDAREAKKGKIIPKLRPIHKFLKIMEAIRVYPIDQIKVNDEQGHIYDYPGFILKNLKLLKNNFLIKTRDGNLVDFGFNTSNRPKDQNLKNFIDSTTVRFIFGPDETEYEKYLEERVSGRPGDLGDVRNNMFPDPEFQRKLLDNSFYPKILSFYEGSRLISGNKELFVGSWGDIHYEFGMENFQVFIKPGVFFRFLEKTDVELKNKFASIYEGKYVNNIIANWENNFDEIQKRVEENESWLLKVNLPPILQNLFKNFDNNGIEKPEVWKKIDKDTYNIVKSWITKSEREGPRSEYKYATIDKERFFEKVIAQIHLELCGAENKPEYTSVVLGKEYKGRKKKKSVNNLKKRYDDIKKALVGNFRLCRQFNPEDMLYDQKLFIQGLPKLSE